MSRTQATQIPIPAEIFPTKTCICLQNAWVRAMQCSAGYEQAAHSCEDARLTVVAHAFRFTAAQEREHAAVLGGLVCCMDGEVPQEAPPPGFSLPRDPARLLEEAVRLEEESAEVLLPGYARESRAEGYSRIAMVLLRIAETERAHADRFRRYAEALRTGSLFRDTACVSWFCLPCGQLHTGAEAPAACSSCGRANGQFIRSNFEPFTARRTACVNCNPGTTVL